MSTENPPHPSLAIPGVDWRAGYRFSLRQYEQMIASGVLGPSDRVELLEGMIVEMTPIGSEHAVAVMLAEQAIRPLLPDGWIVRAGQPIMLRDSQPEPDVAVVRGAIRDFTRSHPGSDCVDLVVEVSDSSLRSDREQKVRIYARAGLQEYWIINLGQRQIELFRDPETPPDSAAGYRTRQVVAASGTVPLTLDGQEIGSILVQDLLP